MSYPIGVGPNLYAEVSLIGLGWSLFTTLEAVGPGGMELINEED